MAGHRGCVPGNRWDLLDAPALPDFDPQLSVSVVVPAYEGQAALDRVLAGLAAQSYPAELLEVFVVDDGSEPPLVGGAPATVIRQVRDGFGLARARNTGAAATTGDVVVFLDADMVPERQFVAAHARWHHVCDMAVVLGFRHHTDLDHLDPAEVGRMVAAREIADAALRRDLGRPDWLEAHFERTSDATVNAPDLYRLLTGGNFSIRRADYSALGGSSEAFREYGGEDRELAYRAQVDGLLFVPERAAHAWHQGPGGWQADDIEERKRQADERLASYIADQSMRGLDMGQGPAPMVTIRTGDVAATTAALRAGLFKDVEVIASGDDGWRFSPIVIDVDPAATFSGDSLTHIVQRVRNPQLGRLDVRVGGREVATARLRRAVRRLERCGLPEDDQMAGFGSDIVDGAEIGIGLRRSWRRGRRRS